MSELLSIIFQNIPSWAQFIISIITIIGVFVAFGLVIYTIWKYARAIDRESKVFDLSKQNQKLFKENQQINYFNSVLSANFELLEEILPTLEMQIDKIFEVWKDDVPIPDKQKRIDEIKNIFFDSIQRYIDVLTSEFNSHGNKCRISVWKLVNDEKLKIIARSSTFLRSSNRELSINNSIVGRAYRKGIKQLSKHLDSDPDWEKYLIDSRYKSISAFPIQNETVISVDYKNVPTVVEERLTELIVNGLDNIFSKISKVSIYLEIIESEVEENGIT